MPQQSIIDGFKGTLDYYLHDGVACARRWPRSPGHTRAPAVMAQWEAFSFAGSYWNNLSVEVKEAWNAMADGFPLTGRDLFTRSFISGDTLIFEEP